MGALVALAIAAAQPPGGVAAWPCVADGELAQARGGFALPGGMALRFSVDVAARVDGRPVYALALGAGANGALTGAALGPGNDAAVTLDGDGAGAAVRYATDTLRIAQTVGRATGIVVANTGQDRTIDVRTTVTAELSGLATARYTALLPALRLVAPAPVRR